MTLLLDVAFAASVLFAAGWMAAVCLRASSADVRRTIWRAVFVGVAALPVVLAVEPPEAAAPFVALAAPAAVSAATHAAADVPWLLVIWAIGVVIVAGRLTAGLVQVRRWGRSAVSGDGADFTAAITVPMTWGVVRPQILLPAEARSWTDETRDLVVRHEAAHVASRDWAWQTMARLVTALLWFHPLAWVADRQLRREAERSADDGVLTGGADPAAYATELLRVARSMSPGSSATVAAVGMVEASSLEQRIRHVLDRSACRAPAGWAMRALVAVFVIALTASAALQEPPPVYDLGEGITNPKVIKEVRPVYSKEAMDKKIQGEVLLKAVVTEDGLVSDIQVIKSLEPSLDSAATDAALQWRFEPARKDGEPVRVWVTLALSFRLF